MKRFRLPILLAGCLVAAQTSHAQDPIQEIGWDKFGDAVDSTEIVVIALIDEFNPSDTSNIPGNHTPSEMLRFYVGGTAMLAENDSRISLYYHNCPDSPGRIKLSNLVAKAFLIHKTYGFQDDVDGSFPKVFLFHRGKAVQHWSYKRKPGIELENRITAAVRQLLN